MAKYIMVYKRATNNNWTDLPKEQVTKMMEAWGEWLGSMGSAVIERGDAFKYGGKSVSIKGEGVADNFLSGYSVIEAKDFDEALKMAKGSPTIATGGSVEVYEAFGV